MEAERLPAPFYFPIGCLDQNPKGAAEGPGQADRILEGTRAL